MESGGNGAAAAARARVRDRSGRLAALAAGADAVLELGCGARKRIAGSIGVDARDLEGVDVVGDVFDVLAAVPDGAIAAVHCSHFLEHVAPLEGLLREVARVLRRGGRLVAVVPHFSSPYYHSDPTHRTPFGLYTFSYVVRDELFARRVPHYAPPLPLRLERVRLRFKSPKAFRLRRALKRPLEALVNLGPYTQELYEELFCWWVPCYEVAFELSRE